MRRFTYCSLLALMVSAVTMSISNAQDAQYFDCKHVVQSSNSAHTQNVCPPSFRNASGSMVPGIASRDDAKECCCPSDAPLIWSDQAAKCIEFHRCQYSCCPGGTKHCGEICCHGICGLRAGNLTSHCCASQSIHDRLCCADHKFGMNCSDGSSCCKERGDPSCVDLWPGCSTTTRTTTTAEGASHGRSSAVPVTGTLIVFMALFAICIVTSIVFRRRLRVAFLAGPREFQLGGRSGGRPLVATETSNNS